MQFERRDALPSGSEIHGYLIKHVLGSGAFGITYLAEHRHLNTHHVIKEYLPECALREHNRSTVSPKSTSDMDLFSWGSRCFFDEAKLLHQLSHPHIIKVADLFEANGTAYFVMPYLRGITLHEWMKKHPAPSQKELEAIFVPLIEGLKYIHDKGLLHRDVKPENIYILENSHPILIDFGSARMAIGQKSKALTQVLTPHFAPIEQYASKGTYTPAMDLYGLAACMYQAITGELPEEAPNRLVNDEQPKLRGSEHERRYAAHFLQAIDKSLNVHAKDRHQNGFDFQKDLLGTNEIIALIESDIFHEEENAKSKAVCRKCTDHGRDNLKGFIKVDDYFFINEMTQIQVIENIKNNKFNGKYVNGSWYISFSDVRSSTVNSDTSFNWRLMLLALVIVMFLFFIGVLF